MMLSVWYKLLKPGLIFCDARPVLQEVSGSIYSSLFPPAFLYGEGKCGMPIVLPPPHVLKRRGNVNLNPFCSLWPNKKGHGSRIWFILCNCENKSSLYIFECHTPRMIPMTPVERIEEVQEGNFFPGIHFSCSYWDVEFQHTASVLIFFYAASCFLLSRRSSHSQQVQYL